MFQVEMNYRLVGMNTSKSVVIHVASGFYVAANSTGRNLHWIFKNLSVRVRVRVRIVSTLTLTLKQHSLKKYRP